MHHSDIPLPHSWPRLVRQAVLHIASLAHHSMVYTRSMAVNSPIARVRLAAKVDRLEEALAFHKEIISIKDARMAKITPQKRPHYSPTDRLRILELRAAHGWSASETARRFQVSDETIAKWLESLGQPDRYSLVRVSSPINRLPDLVTHVTQRMKAVCPRLGKRSIALILVRLGLNVSATTVGRRLKKRSPRPPKRPVANITTCSDVKTVRARHPNHIWHLDLTAVPTTGGFWSPTVNVLPQSWPFCWWVLVILDHYSRRCMGFALFKRSPSTRDITIALDKAIRHNGKPKHLISDKGCQFWNSRAKHISESRAHPYHIWAKEENIRLRFGAIGKSGSIAVLERFIRTLKEEHFSLLTVPFAADEMRRELCLYIAWYNMHRPHQHLKGLTPEDVYARAPPGAGRDIPTLQAGWPNHDASQEVIDVGLFEGRKHLPVFSLKSAA